MLKFFKMIPQPITTSLSNNSPLRARISYNTYRTTGISGYSRAFCTDKDSKEIRFNLHLFNPRDKSHREKFNTLIDAEITRKEKKIEPFKSLHGEMVDWLKKYVACSDFMALYTDEHSLELTAEATFWSIKLGLEPHLKQMSYEEIKTFQPLKEGFTEETSRARAIDEVCSKLEKPAMSHEASYALQQAAWCVYVHHNSYEQLKENEATYNSSEPINRP